MNRYALIVIITLFAGCVDDGDSGVPPGTEEVQEGPSTKKPPPTCPVTTTCPAPPWNGHFPILYWAHNSCSAQYDISCYWGVDGTTFIDIEPGCEHCRPVGSNQEFCGQNVNASTWTCSAQ